MNQPSVIGIFCYKRPAKLRDSLEALLRNPEAKDSDLVIFADGARGSHDLQGVTETRALIDSTTGFRSITRFYRDGNVGLLQNFKTGLEHLAANYDRFIVVEDDLVVSPNFLSYMNQGLDFYAGDPSVFCVTGYAFPMQIPASYTYDAVVAFRLCVYGWGSWSDRIRRIDWDLPSLKQRAALPGFYPKVNREGLDMGRMVRKMIDGRISSWDVLIQVHISEQELKVIYPVRSKTTNIGFDAESTHTFGYNYLETAVDNTGQASFRFPPASLVEPALVKDLRRPYSLPQLAKRKIYNTAKAFFSRFSKK